MANNSVVRVARKLNDLERRHEALARSRQLPLSSVRLTTGDSVFIGATSEAANDATANVDSLGELVGSVDSAVDAEAYGSISSQESANDLAVESQTAFDAALVANTKAAAAKAEAAAALQEAANATETSNGKNARRRGATEPPPPPGGWANGDQWIVDNADGEPVEVRVWNGTSFVREQLLASELLILSGGLIRLADGVVTADAVAADAIDGMVITGPLIRTAATGQRLELGGDGLRSFNAAGTVTSSINSGTGGMKLTGTLYSENANSSRVATLRPEGVQVDSYSPNPSSPVASGVYGATGVRVHVNSGHDGIVGYRGFTIGTAGGLAQKLSLYAASGGVEREVSLSLRANGDAALSVTGALEIGAGDGKPVTFVDDIPWRQAVSVFNEEAALLKNGWLNNVNINWDGLKSCKRHKVTFITGAVTKATAYGSLEVVATLPPKLAPEVPSMIAGAYGAAAGYLLVRPNGDIVTAQAGTGGQIAMNGVLLPIN